ncbi:MAG TPA: hypothetical protein VGK99_14460 [Acidobacteriota bacterium]|jgi:hypothetical protein
MDTEPAEIEIEIGKQKVRLGSETMEEDIENLFAAIIEELVLPVVENSSQWKAEGSTGERFWDEVFRRIAVMVSDFSAAERKLVLRALISVETHRRFLQLLDDATSGA